MKGNTFRIIAGLLTTTVMGVLVYKRYKKVYSEIEEAEDKEKDHLQNDLGLSEKAAEEVVQESALGEMNYTKLVFRLMKLGKSKYTVDKEILDGELALASKKVIHVKTDKDYTKATIIFQIPNYVNKVLDTQKYVNGLLAKKEPKVGQYITEIKSVMEDYWETTNRSEDESAEFLLRGYLRGYAVVTCKNPLYDSETQKYSKLVSKTMELPASVYANFVEKDKRGRDGLVPFYEDSIRKGTINPESVKEIDRYLSKEVLGSSLDIEGLYLGWKIEVPIKGADAFSPEELAELLKYAITEINIPREDGKDPIQYEHIIFHAPDLAGYGDAVYDFVDGEFAEFSINY